ncbi:RNA polymerase II subunit A C-terminal domain phosphatase-like [Dendronephthya gigantea]|uniref:RNA polymerase II subunit A C-terminal domain phosphatase-like n=1 Tax=Dendronephthya gigantea TaxID=151771 RepID=UPI0010690B72|nr:RNA polymerase II subunit A C-terminal domain phosphatase-like [Dendronephthya gigantea]
MTSVLKMAENFQDYAQNELVLSRSSPCQLLKWKISANQKISKGSILAVYKKIAVENPKESQIVVLPKLKSEFGGSVKRLLVNEGERVKPGQPVILLDVCEHKIVMKEMCAECGQDLRQEPGIPGQLKEPVSASVALVHNIPELRVSQKEAEILARKDKEILLKNGKLVLLVDLDQTLIHTTTENVHPDMKDVYHFQLYGQSNWYHTKFRPGWKKFLENMSKCYELHIFTMGSRMYAHTIARMLDPSGVLFSERIRSRDESFDMFSKYRDLRALFPCDDSMVCIIDDREDIWDCAPNLVTVKPYRYFTGTGDINAPPGSEQAFTHPSAIPLHENATEVGVEDSKDGKDADEMDKESEEVIGKSTETSMDNSEKNVSDVSENTSTEEDKLEGGGSERNVVDEVNQLESNPIEEKENKDGEVVAGENKQSKSNGEDVEETDDGHNSEKENDNVSTQVSDKSHVGDTIDGNHIEDHDDYLLYLEDILRRIHNSFYEVVAWNKQAEEKGDAAASVAPDLRCIVPELRRNVLRGTNIVFTGVIPTNTAHEESQAWKIAQQFGANVSKDLLTQKNTSERSKRTTHVIAARPGTEKACQALRSPAVRLVNPNWLWTCAERWDWVDERLFPVEDYHEYKAQRNDTPTSSRRSTPRRQLGDETGSKNSKITEEDESDETVDHISDDNLKIVLNPFLGFSRGEMEAMDKEVEDLMRSSDEEDEDDKEDSNKQILGSVSSSSNSTENGNDMLKSEHSLGEDLTDGSFQGDCTTDNAGNFSTIKQNRNEDEGSPSKRRKLDFVEDNGDEEGSMGEFSSDGDSSGSNSGDDEGNDMAAMLEAELNRP